MKYPMFYNGTDWRTRKFFWRLSFKLCLKADRAADIQREKLKNKRREMEQQSLDATSDLLDTDSNATFAMVNYI